MDLFHKLQCSAHAAKNVSKIQTHLKMFWRKEKKSLWKVSAKNPAESIHCKRPQQHGGRVECRGKEPWNWLHGLGYYSLFVTIYESCSLAEVSAYFWHSSAIQRSTRELFSETEDETIALYYRTKSRRNRSSKVFFTPISRAIWQTPWIFHLFWEWLKLSPR